MISKLSDKIEKKNKNKHLNLKKIKRKEKKTNKITDFDLSNFDDYELI